MIESIIKLTKKYPPLYNFLKNNTFVNGLLNYIYLSLFVLKKEK
jgi:hypothetical protein